MKLKPNLVVAEAMAGQTDPVDRVLALLDVLLRSAASIIEGDDAVGGTDQVGHDEADTEIEFAGTLRRGQLGYHAIEAGRMSHPSGKCGESQHNVPLVDRRMIHAESV